MISEQSTYFYLITAATGIFFCSYVNKSTIHQFKSVNILAVLNHREL